MYDYQTPIITAIFSGIVFNRSWYVNLLRISIYLSLVVVFLIPIFIKLNIFLSIVFSVCISAFIFIIKFSLYFLNKIIDRSFEINSVTETPLFENNGRPPDIPSLLWDRRYKYRSGEPLTDDEALDLIYFGFDADAVFEFSRILQSGNYDNEAHSSVIQPTTTFLNICGKNFKLSFSRQSIDKIFPSNESLVYVILITVLSFILSFLEARCRFISCWTFGPAIYSMLHPPEVDPYSTTKGNVFFGISRAFYLSIILSISFILDYLASNDNLKIMHINYFEISINWESISNFVIPVCKYVTYLFPILLLLILGSASSTISWTLEWLGRYFLGLSGCSDVSNSIIQFLRSFFVFSLVTLILFFQSSKFFLCFSIALTSLLVQIPISYLSMLSTHWMRYTIQLIFYTLFSFLFAFIGTFINNFNCLFIVSGVLAFSIDILFPYISSINKYWIFYFQIVTGASDVFTKIRTFIFSLFAPIILSSLITNDNCIPFWFSAILIVSSINRSLCENHIFSISIIICLLLFNFDLKDATGLFHFLPHRQCIFFFLSQCITRKLFSILSILHFYRNSRSYSNLDVFLDNDPLLLISFVNKIFKNLPGPDRAIQFPSLLWSLITGAPFTSPKLQTYLLFPSPPRSNYFWDANNGQYFNPKLFSFNLTEHPIETPVYFSLSRGLSLTLSSLIKNGKLGIVNSNDVFLFINSTMSLFVHIIEFEPNCVRFQIRGLEYNNTTGCHIEEISSLRNFTQDYVGFPSILPNATYSLTYWVLRTKNIPITAYSASNINLESAFLGVETEEIIEWVQYSVAYVISKNFHYIENINSNQENKDINYFYDTNSIIEKIRNFYEGDISQEKALKILQIFESIENALLSHGDINTNNIFELFNEKYQFEREFTPKELKFIVFPAIRFSILILILVSSSLAPQIEINSEVIDFIETTDKECYIDKIDSAKLALEFQKENKDLYSMIEKNHTISIIAFSLIDTTWDVFSIQKEAVRCFWASEAKSQLFFGEDDNERHSIQMNIAELHNLIVQSCNFPIGYPAFVSPIMASYYVY